MAVIVVISCTVELGWKLPGNFRMERASVRQCKWQYANAQHFLVFQNRTLIPGEVAFWMTIVFKGFNSREPWTRTHTQAALGEH